MLRSALTWSFILLLAMVLLMLGPYYLGIEIKNKIFLSIVSFIVFAAILAFGQRSYRELLPRKELKYGNAFVFGLLTGGLYAIFMVVVLYLLFRFLATDYYEYIVNESKLSILNNQLMSEEAKEIALKSQEAYLTPGKMSMFSLLGSFFNVLISCLIASFFGMGVGKKEEIQNSEIE